MTLHYDSKKQIWFHQTDENSIIPFGASYLLSHGSPSMISLPVTLLNKSAIPLVGILTSRTKEGKLFGNSRLFKQIQTELLDHGGLSFIFSLQDIEQREIKGCVYHPENDCWHEALFPLPSMVYNRIPLRKEEQSDDFLTQTSFFTENHIPFFNPCFMNKWALYRAFQKNDILTTILPNTDSIHSEETIAHFLLTHSKVYIKHVASSRGKGLAFIERKEDGSLFYQSISKEKKYASVSDLWNDHPEWKKDYIVQEQIMTDSYQGRKYDLRVMCHRQKESYKVTGIGVRVAGKRNYITHVTSGGSVVSYERIKNRINEEFIQKIVTHCGHCLTNEFGWMGEFSMDLGLGTDGNLYLFEVNSKPMKFDEEVIEKDRIRSLLDIFLSI
ncbi:YheC/YheD family endospore coat-associated protein [Bacillus sp. 2205SS5-2]|uniref:YheC/YheD family endospore coat-associated protein n=1 Tax=Bacillus sp. 2205SS5-2 TaxID=3109031 RepID=UPI003006B9B8